MSGCGEEGRSKTSKAARGVGAGKGKRRGDELDKDENIGPSGRETKG